MAEPTQQQTACIKHVDGPLLVSAGAGSGKTFMLTQRIAYALLNPDKSGVDDIDQVLAITFTDLAASEIKARVRNKLREEGLGAQALKVDACWISTIHGMCSRILRENALELGIDPAFALLDETDRDQLLADCIDAALAGASPAASKTPRASGRPGVSDAEGASRGSYRALFEEFESVGSASEVGSMLREIVNAAANVRGGLAALRTAEPLDPHEIAVEMRAAMEHLDAVAREGIGANGKAQDAFTIKARDALEHPQTGMPLFERLAADRSLTHERVAKALMQVDLSFGSGTRKEPYATEYALFKAAYMRLCLEAGMGVALEARNELLELAERVQELFDAEKAQRGVLDQNDLLLQTLRAFEGNPAVRQRYSEKFRLVMVDEFQDTSALQIALISHLTSGDRTLCTVGDTQQSIYRFRGADVATYLEHKEHMRALQGQGALCCELDKNFRSHGDIITFVNRVFGDDEVFDQREFLKLRFDKKHGLDKRNAFPPVPRIDVVCTSHPSYSPTVPGAQRVKSDDLHVVEAEAIARRFEALHDTGSPNCAWGDMVILLGKMSRADVYARTLRAHGIPCIITGGSGFSKTPEAQEVRALLEAIANPLDNVALRAALGGAAFGLGADELLRLATGPTMRRRDIWEGLQSEGAGDPSPRVRLAASVLGDAVAQAGSRGVGELLMDVVLASGWLDRLQGQGPQGMAGAANVLKAVRLAEKIERGDGVPRGLPATAARLALELEQGIKEKPGTLMVEGQDAVRILTVHASKGLEFPVVALADFYGLKARTGSLVLETAGETIWLSLKPGASTAKGGALEGLLETKLTDAQARKVAEASCGDEPAALEEGATAGELHEALLAHANAEELGELRRKFYVGATRPREALVLAVNGKESKTGWKDVVGDLCRALFGPEGDFCTTPEGIDFGGEERAVVQRIRLSRDDEGALLVGDVPAAQYLRPAMLGVSPAGEAVQGEPVPEAPMPGEHLRELVPGVRPCEPLRAGTFSYSGIAPAGLAEDRVDPRAGRPAGGGAEPAHGDPRAFGSAVHQVCQLAAERLAEQPLHTGLVDLTELGNPEVRHRGRRSFAMPEPACLLAALRTWGLGADELPALEQAVARWVGSSAARKAAAYDRVWPEAPFYVALQGPQGEPIHLEGSIDLLCWDAGTPLAEQIAYVVDYKTGGLASENAEELRRKHLLQAECYAVALLKQGFGVVRLQFVRLEQGELLKPDEPQTVGYVFWRDDLQVLEESVRAAYAQATR